MTNFQNVSLSTKIYVNSALIRLWTCLWTMPQWFLLLECTYRTCIIRQFSTFISVNLHPVNLCNLPFRSFSHNLVSWTEVIDFYFVSIYKCTKGTYQLKVTSHIIIYEYLICRLQVFDGNLWFFIDSKRRLTNFVKTKHDGKIYWSCIGTFDLFSCYYGNALFYVAMASG